MLIPAPRLHFPWNTQSSVFFGLREAGNLRKGNSVGARVIIWRVLYHVLVTVGEVEQAPVIPVRGGGREREKKGRKGEKRERWVEGREKELERG